MTVTQANHPDIRNIQAGTHAFFQQGDQVVVRALNANSWKFKVGAALSRLGLSDNWNLFKSHLPVADPEKIQRAISALLAARETRTQAQSSDADAGRSSFKSLQDRVVTRPFEGRNAALSVPERLAQTKHALQMALNLEENANKVLDRVGEALGHWRKSEKAAPDAAWSLTLDDLQEKLQDVLGAKGKADIDQLATTAPGDSDRLTADIARRWVEECNCRTFSKWAGAAFYSEPASDGRKPLIDKETLCDRYRAELKMRPLGETTFHGPEQCVAHAERLAVLARAEHLLNTVGKPIPDFFAKGQTHPSLAHIPDDGSRTDAIRELLLMQEPSALESNAISRRMIENAVNERILGSARPAGSPPDEGQASSSAPIDARHRDDARDLLVRMHGVTIRDRATSQAALEKASSLADAHLPAILAGLATIDRTGAAGSRRDALLEVLFDEVTTRNQGDQDARITALNSRLQTEASRRAITEIAPQQAVSTEASDFYAAQAHGETREQLFGTGADAARQQAIDKLAAIGYDPKLLQTIVSALDARMQQRFEREIDGTNATTLRDSILRDYQQQLQDMAMIGQVPGLNGAMVVAQLQVRFNAVRIACKTIAGERSPSADQVNTARQALQALHEGVVKANVHGSDSQNLQQLVVAQMGRDFAGQPARLTEELITMSRGLATLSAREGERKSFLGYGGRDPVVVATLGALSEGARGMLAHVNALG